MGKSEFTGKGSPVGGRNLRVVDGGGAGSALPNAVDAERSVISGCMQWPDSCVPVAMAKRVTAEAFYLPAHRIIYRAVSQCWERGVPIELKGFSELLRADGVLEEVGGHQAIALLWMAEVTTAHFERRVDEVVAALARRNLWVTAEKSKEAAMDPSTDAILEMERLQARSRELVAANRRMLAVAIPPEGDERPRLDVGQPVQALSRELGVILGQNGFYRRAETRMVVTVASDGRVETVTARRLRGAVGKFVYPVAWEKVRDREVPKDLAVEAAATLLETDSFLDLLPELRGVARVKVPVWKGGAVELSRRGYDPETGIFCSDLLPFEEGLDLAQARAVFDELLGAFEFEDGTTWAKCRSGVLQVAMMVGTFCAQLLGSGKPRPLAVYVANQPGAGKTLLAFMAICHVLGKVAAEDYPPGRAGQEELKKILDIAAIEQAPVQWFDDVPEHMQSNALNRFVTASRHKPRILGKSEKVDVPAVTQVFATGNHTKVNRDLSRRGLVVELFVPGDIQERQFRVELTQDLLASPEWRAKSLAACWALVRAWTQQGCPMRRHAPLKGFSDYTALVGGVMACAGMDADPFAEPQLPMSGDEDTTEMQRLLVAVAEEWRDHGAFTNGDALNLDEIVQVARREQIQLVDGRGRDIIGREGDDVLDSGARKSLGAQLKKWRGRHLKTGDGERFQFGRREQANGSVYPLTFLSAD